MSANGYVVDLLRRLDAPDPHDPATWRIDGLAPSAMEVFTVMAATTEEFAAASALDQATRCVLVAELHALTDEAVARAERAGDQAEADRLRFEFVMTANGIRR